MKSIFIRRFRNHASSIKEGSFFKPENQEQSFIVDQQTHNFFKPSVNTQSSIQRKCQTCKEDDKVQRLPEKKEKDEKKLMRMENNEEEENLQLQPEEEEELQKKENSPAITTPALAASHYIHSLNGKGKSLPAHQQFFFGGRMGHDFSNVKLHTDKEAAQSAKNINAKAYTVGNNIVFNEGQFDPASLDGKKLMAHELAHVMQQEKKETISRKGEEETGQECTAGSVDLEALTEAKYKKGAGTAKNEVTKKSKGCDGCEDDSCVSITGSLKVPYNVATKINLPVVPANLSPCQQDRVRVAINTTLMAHEKKHVKAFENFNGTASLPISYQGCAENYVSYQEGLSENEFQRRQAAADAKSAALDPFSVPVDLCCKDKPKK